MINHLKSLRWVLAAVFATGVIVLSTFVLSPTVEAADCGGSSGGISSEWLSTSPRAIIKNALNECGAGATCEEMCTVSCGDDIQPQGVFRCRNL